MEPIKFDDFGVVLPNIVSSKHGGPSGASEVKSVFVLGLPVWLCGSHEPTHHPAEQFRGSVPKKCQVQTSKCVGEVQL